MDDGVTPQVLVSAAAHAALLEATQGWPCEFVTLEAAGDDSGVQVHAAFISRDITGASTKTQLSPAVQSTYAVLRRSPQLRWVHTHSAGADRPIYGELRQRGVIISTSSGANAQVVAQTALAAVLAQARRLPQLWAAQRERRWAPLIDHQTPPDLSGQNALLVGWGPIARHLAPWLQMLGLNVTVLRHSAGVEAAPGLPTHPYTALSDCLPQADWLVLACPLSAATRGLVNAEALARARPNLVLVNVARGEVVDETALTAALRAGRIGAAWLDVFSTEPLPPESPMWRLPQVQVMPHSAGHAAGNAQRVQELFVQNLRAWLEGRPLVNSAA
jgi:D-2-hydroxyacid dehydrogenase (NADP+)